MLNKFCLALLSILVNFLSFSGASFLGFLFDATFDATSALLSEDKINRFNLLWENCASLIISNRSPIEASVVTGIRRVFYFKLLSRCWDGTITSREFAVVSLEVVLDVTIQFFLLSYISLCPTSEISNQNKVNLTSLYKNRETNHSLPFSMFLEETRVQQH
jgi:hypothetical protein